MSIADVTGFNRLAAPDGAESMPPALELDAGKYVSDLADFDLTEAQKIELLETLWSIMRRFVELGFSVDICGQLLNLADGTPNQAETDVKYLPSTIEGATADDEARDSQP